MINTPDDDDDEFDDELPFENQCFIERQNDMRVSAKLDMHYCRYGR